LIRQFLTESLLVSVSGGVLGIVVAYETLAVLKAALAALPLNIAMLPVLIPAEASIGLNGRVLLFATVLSLVSGVAFGLAPSLGSVRHTEAVTVGSGRRSSGTVGHRRLRGALIVAEVAVAFVLVVNAGLLLRSFLTMRQADTGFDATNVITAELPVKEHRFADPGQLHAFVHQILAKVQALPGVSDAAFTDGMPMEGAPTGIFFQIATRPLLPRVQRPLADLRLVTPAYFRVLGLRLRRGRVLSDLDRVDTPLVVVINETLARTHFGHEDPVGQRLLMERPGFGSVYTGEASSFEIVGVIADERLWPWAFDDRRERAVVYLSAEQDPRGFAGIVVRTSLEPSRMERSLRTAIAAVDKDQAVTDVKTVDQLKSESMIPDRLRFSLVGLFAAMALALAAIGIYGVISHSVVQRTHELGIRSALGASPASLVGLAIRRGMALAAIGLAMGALASLEVTRLLRSVLFGVGSFDPLTWIATGSVLAAVAGLACYLPARHATQVDPLDALRAE
jgi:putative ABC transport system permease protein